MKNPSFSRKSLLYVLLYLPLLFTSCKKETTQGPTTEERYSVTNSDVMNIGGIIAKQIYSSKNLQLKSTSGTEAIDKVFPVGEDSVMFVINYKNHNGFTILSGDKATTPVIMYSENGTINPDSVSDAFTAWVAQSKSYIKYNKTHLSRDKKMGIKKIWDDLLAGKTYMFPSHENTSKSQLKTVSPGGGQLRLIVSPLISTLWSQGCLYNANCPLVDDGPCGHAYTGCVATAMAQVMNYWKYPASYDWSQMPSDYGSAETARLMYDVGVSVGMTYGGYSAGGSGAPGGNIPGALINKFGYSSSATYAGYDYNTIQTNLQNKWPVIIVGYANSRNYYTGIWPFRNIHTVYTNGHAWVCCGCLRLLQNSAGGTIVENIYLYMNWGHGDSAGNGWCLNTGTSFQEGTSGNIYQYNLNVVYNIHP